LIAKRVGRHVCDRRVESHDLNVLDADRPYAGQFVAQTLQPRWWSFASSACEKFTRRGCEGERRGFERALTGGLNRDFQHRLVPAMHAVEIADSDGRRARSKRVGTQVASERGTRRRDGHQAKIFCGKALILLEKLCAALNSPRRVAVTRALPNSFYAPSTAVRPFARNSA